MKFKFTFIAAFFFTISCISFCSSQTLLDENFDYLAGDSIGAHGWIHNNNANNRIFVTSPGLTYAGYPLSGIGNAATLTTSGQDVFKALSDSSNTAAVYASFMVNVTSAQTGDYFLAFLPTTSTALYSGRVQARFVSSVLDFGLTKSSVNDTNTMVWATGYSLNTTYLLVLKYEFIPGAANDLVSLFILSSGVPTIEPTPTIGPMSFPSFDPNNIGRVALRQGTSTRSADLVIDGISVTKSWTMISANVNAPSKLEAQPIDSSYIKLNWQDNSNDEDGFYIERAQINDPSYWEVIDVVLQNVNQYSDYFVPRRLRYYYRVKAYSDNIHSGYSNIDSAILGGNPSFIPAPPSNLVLVKRTANANTMDWYDNSGNENGFIIFRKTEGDLFFEIADSVGTDVVTYQEVGVSPDLDHYYKICSYNASGISDYSNTLIVPGKSAPDINESKLARNNVLSGNYPNPFNPFTVIRYSLIENRFIILKVYDMLGKEILTLVNEKQNAGTYSVDFDGSNFSSGVYFYKLQVGEFVEMKRMILIK